MWKTEFCAISPVHLSQQASAISLNAPLRVAFLCKVIYRLLAVQTLFQILTKDTFFISGTFL